MQLILYYSLWLSFLAYLLGISPKNNTLKRCVSLFADDRLLKLKQGFNLSNKLEWIKWIHWKASQWLHIKQDKLKSNCYCTIECFYCIFINYSLESEKENWKWMKREIKPHKPLNKSITQWFHHNIPAHRQSQLRLIWLHCMQSCLFSINANQWNFPPRDCSFDMLYLITYL